MNRKITFVIGCLETGGAERQLVLLASQLATRGWEVTVFTLEKGGALIEVLQQTGVQVLDGGYLSTDGGKLRKLLRLFRAYLRLYFHLVFHRPKVVHGFLPLTNFLASLAGRLSFRPRVIISKRALGTHQDRHPVLGLVDRISNRIAHVVTANSRAVAADTERRDGFSAAKVHVIANGLEFDRFEDAASQRKIRRNELNLYDGDIAMINVANLIPYKGQAELLRAFAEVSGQHLSIKLFLAGADRGIASSLRRESEMLGIADQISWLGARNDIPELLAAMDIGVLPSHEEGLPNALIEKLATGLPVVASDVGGIPEVCEGMPDCALTPVNDPGALASALSAICDDLANVKKRSEKRIALAKHRYSVEMMVSAYEQLYED